MDMGLILVLLAVVMPFVILAMGLNFIKKQQSQAQLERYLQRIGFEAEYKKSYQSEIMNAANIRGVVLMASIFKRAGLLNKKSILIVLSLQAIFLFLSIYAIVSGQSQFDHKILAASLLLPLLPTIFILIRIKKRQDQLRKQFPEMLDAITRALHSGYGIDGALTMVSEEFPAPLGQEMKEVNRQLLLGIGMRDILKDFQKRVDLPEAQFFVVTLILQRETGGQLAAILNELSRLMRRRENFQQKINTLTAESRFTAWFIGGAPFLYLGYKYFFDHENMTFFLTDATGQKMLLVSIVLIVTGAIILKFMLKMRF